MSWPPEGRAADITSNRDLLAWLRAEQPVFVPKERCERNTRLVDFENPPQ